MKVLIYILSLGALAFAAAWLGQRAIGRPFTAAELSLAAMALLAAGARWLVLLRRRQRQKVDEMRDSALW